MSLTSQTLGNAHLETFLALPPEHAEEGFRSLLGTWWHDGSSREGAEEGARAAALAIGGADARSAGFLAVLLGLLAETELPDGDGPLTAAAATELPAYLRRLEDAEPGSPLFLALVYLVAHFPARRAEILGRPALAALDRDETSRLDRALDRLDPAHPKIGRAFPSPAAWDFDGEEQEFDEAWIGELSAEEVRGTWDRDTRTVLGHLGVKAWWAVREDRTPTPAPEDSVSPRTPDPQPAGADLFEPHAAAFRCPVCRGSLGFSDTAATCAACGREWSHSGGVLDLTKTAATRDDDFLFNLATMPTMGFFYEARARPNFLRLCGSNWDGAVTPAGEDEYIREYVRPVEGPVLDLAAGAGRWTRTLAGAVGADRVVALDLGAPMLAALRTVLPRVPGVLSSASSLPFEDASLGAVLCWNALQAFPDDAPAAIAEAGRCLRPGGTLTLLTFRTSDDPIYRYLARSHHFPQHNDGLRLFDADELRGWIAAAGLEIVDEQTPGTFVILTARRPAGQES